MLDDLINLRHADPHRVLGAHAYGNGVRVRAFFAEAEMCCLLEPGGTVHAMSRMHPAGVFEVFLEGRGLPLVYRFELQQQGHTWVTEDPYRFWPTVTPDDLLWFSEGNHHRIYSVLGAHKRVCEGIEGIGFAVWAPQARRVSVVGDFNTWDGRRHLMRSLGASGVWELFIPGVQAGALYKYELDHQGHMFLKSDPYATYCQGAPGHASVVHSVEGYAWGDADWMAQRADTIDKPIAIYELHFGSWRHRPDKRPLTYREMAAELVPYIQQMGFTHVEFLPLNEHPFEGSWGYQVTGFFAPTHRYGTPQDFMFLVDTLHQNGIGVILDWVPGHFPKDSFALAQFDGTHLYEHEDPRQGTHQEWGTLVFNYGRHEVKAFLTASALALFDRYHIDGLRVDAVASMIYLDYARDSDAWVPNPYGGKENLEALAFLKHVNGLVQHYYPGTLMIAEESTSWNGVCRSTQEGGLGFDLKWNMGWMHDILSYFKKDPIYRQWFHNQLTFGMLYHYSEQFMQTFSHDEVVHGKGSLLGKMSGADILQKAQTLRALYVYFWLWPGKKTLFMGSEWGQVAEWDHNRSLDWHLLEHPHHAGIQRLVADLNRLYTQTPALFAHEGDPRNVAWVNCHDSQNSVISFLRFGAGEIFLYIGNFTPVTRSHYRVGVPQSGYWQECFNSDASIYAGCGLGNLGGLTSLDRSWDDQPACLEMTLPGLSSLVFKWKKG